MFLISSRRQRVVRKLISAARTGKFCLCGQQRDIGSSAVRGASSHYDVLDIPQSSTQNDIKAAYYRLSKVYHPDRNQGCEAAAKKFRAISQAYEVLGNYRLRRLYDKGIIHTAGPQYAQHDQTDEPEVEDDPQTKFYKSRFRKRDVPEATGRTPIYDFDEWSRAHYGQSFERRKTAKLKFDRQEEKKHNFTMSSQNEVIIFGISFMAIAVYLVFLNESSNDTPKQRAIRNAEENKNN